MIDFFSSLIYPIEVLVAYIMYGFHQGLTALGLRPESGITWALSIVGLVLVMRSAMIPLFVKQIKSSRQMALIQPKIQAIQKKYKGKNDPESRQAMTQETMALYKSEGTNPFSSCMPILVQSPFFFGLFSVLNGLGPIAAGKKEPVGPITRAVASQAEHASLFGAQLSDKFTSAHNLSTQVLTVVLIVFMSASTFYTQRQMMTKNMSASALDNPFMKQQKVLLYVLPVFFAISGINFPIGVLIYWFVTNIWTGCQQFYVLHRMPAPGSPAERAYHERLAKRGKPIPGAAPASSAVVQGELASAGVTDEGAAKKVSRQRVQPKGKKRAKAAGQGNTSAPQAGEPPAGSSGSDAESGT